MELLKHLLGITTFVAIFFVGVGATELFRSVGSLLARPQTSAPTVERTAAFDHPAQRAVPGSQMLRPEMPGRYYLDVSFEGEFGGVEYIDIPDFLFGNDQPAGWNTDYQLEALIDGQTFKSQKYLIDGNQIAFQFTTFTGDTYMFSGSIRQSSRCGIKIARPGMEGRLTKLKDGKPTSTMNAYFSRIWGC